MANVTPDINKLMWLKDANKFAWIDRAKAIMDFATRAGTMYLGYQAFEKLAPGSGLSGAIVSQIAMKLATSNNLIAGGTGVAVLAALGITNMNPSVEVGGSRSLDVHTWAKNLATSPEPIDVHTWR